MKVKLLKKLRKKAREEYWIEYRPFENKVFSVRFKGKSYWYGFDNKQNAIETLIELRRDFILNKVYEKRNYRIYD